MYRELYSSEYSSVMQTEALKLWHELEQESGQQLLKRHGLLFYGDIDTGETVQASCTHVAAEQCAMCSCHLPIYVCEACSFIAGKFAPMPSSCRTQRAVSQALYDGCRAASSISHECKRGV